MKDQSGKTKLTENLMAPLIVGIVVLIGQSVLQPWASERLHANTERWNAKRAAFIQALAVVDKQFASRRFEGPDAPKDAIVLGKEPDPSEINSVYNNLVLMSDHRDIVDAFLGCLGMRKEQSYVGHNERINLIQLMRRELGFNNIDLTPNDVRFWMLKQGGTSDAPKSAPQ